MLINKYIQLETLDMKTDFPVKGEFTCFTEFLNI